MYRIIPYFTNNDKYIFNTIFGFVYSIKPHNKTDVSTTSFVPDYIIDPYKLRKRTISVIPQILTITKCYAYFLLFAWKYCYPLIYIISHLHFPIYEDAGSANLAFREITKHKNQRVLCLPRAVFIATTSKRFKQHGAMFIGCFFPSRHMHAWVIEDGMQADVFDNQWTSFTPLVIMRH